MKVNLILAPRRWLAWPSLHLTGILGVLVALGPALSTAWGSMPDDLRASLPQGCTRIVAGVCLALVFIAHFVELELASTKQGGENAQ